MICRTYYESPLGTMLLAQREEGLAGAWFSGQKYFPDLAEAEERETPVLCRTKLWLDRYFEGRQPEADPLPLAPEGSEFRRQVWQLLCRIPWGRTVTYGEIARELASLRGAASLSAQAVGGAVGHNPISVIIPCHRVVGANGSLTGYAGGLERKKFLLELEDAAFRR